MTLALAVLAAACTESGSEDGNESLVSDSFQLGPLGGQATVYDSTSRAFSREVEKLSIEESRSFNRGRALFRDVWVIAPASTNTRDGLGPVFNARACEACHVEDGRGRPPEAGQPFTTMLVRLSIPGEGSHGEPLPVPNYGGQLQNFSVPGVPAEGSPSVEYLVQAGSFDDGEAYELLQPQYSFDNLAFGALPADLLFSPRVAPSMIGLGLLEAIPEQAIRDLADPEDQDGDGISGRINEVWDFEAEALKLGRFGWKANQPNLRQQTAGAFLGDIGITSSIFTNENCAEAQAECTAAASGSEDGQPELIDIILDDVTFYSATLAVPAQRNESDPEVIAGKALFFEANCNTCHVAQFETGDNPFSDRLAGQTIHPFTDLLLHDMGPELADNRPDFLASGREWRTPPLWGLGLIETVNSHSRLLHDGRARNISEAILWHGGEGQSSRDAYKAMSSSERQQLIKFLESL
ncbi:di-heme oxidoredictase family protein [Pseudobacteriovorax antillogorgiicola]